MVLRPQAAASKPLPDELCVIEQPIHIGESFGDNVLSAVLQAEFDLASAHGDKRANLRGVSREGPQEADGASRSN